MDSYASTGVQPSNTLLDYVYPVNQLSNQRELNYCPRIIEKWIGDLSYPFALEIKGNGLDKESEYREEVKLVQQVGEKLIKKFSDPGISFEFTVIYDENNNASWSLPGGKVATTINLIKNLHKNLTSPSFDRAEFKDLTVEDKIAAVLSYEMVYSYQRYTTKTYIKTALIELIIKVSLVAISYVFSPKSTRSMFQLVEEGNPFLEKIELIFDTSLFYTILKKIHYHNVYEADRYSLHLMKKAGFNPQAALWLHTYFATCSNNSTKSDLANKIYNWFRTTPQAYERRDHLKECLKI